MASTSFAEAQQRIAERREARAAARLAAQQTSPQDATTTSPTSRHPGWASSLLSPFSALLPSEAARPAFRVGQLDAELLDDELVQLLRGHVGDALKYFRGGHAHDDWVSEIQLALRAVLFKLTVWDHDATYGAALQNLRFSDARRDGPVVVPPSVTQKLAYGLVTVFGRYGWTKWEEWLRDQDTGYDETPSSVQRLSRWTDALTTVHDAAAIVSFLVFLVKGRYRTLLDRMLRMRLVPPTSQISREVSFEYQNRQLVWHAFTEFLLFVLPLIGISRWRRIISRTWRKTKSVMQRRTVEDIDKAGEYAFLPERTCAICYQEQNASTTTENEILAAAAAGGVVGSAETDITNPYETVPCGCVYCFVCLASSIEREEGDGWACLRCGELVKECRPWSGDVLERVQRSTSTKTVAFSDEVQDMTQMGGSLQIVGPEPVEELED